MKIEMENGATITLFGDSEEKTQAKWDKHRKTHAIDCTVNYMMGYNTCRCDGKTTRLQNFTFKVQGRRHGGGR